RVAADPAGLGLLQKFVIWDCPDMTTWAASGYLSRLLETAALADVIIYVASDERYNDQVPTEFLRLLVQTGKPVIVCLMKMRPTDAPAMLALFQREVLGRLHPGVVACLAIPFLTAEQLADPVRHAASHRLPLINQVASLGETAASARRQTVTGAINYLVA